VRSEYRLLTEASATEKCFQCGGIHGTWAALQLGPKNGKAWKTAQSVFGLPELQSCTHKDCLKAMKAEKEKRKPAFQLQQQAAKDCAKLASAAVQTAAASTNAEESLKAAKTKETIDAKLVKQAGKESAKKAIGDKAPARKRKLDEQQAALDGQQAALDDEMCLLQASFKLKLVVLKYYRKYPDRKRMCLELVHQRG
jgi:hypothetical protein